MNRFFIDWFAVSQIHQHRLDYVGEQMVTRTDLSTGEILSDSPNSKKIDGSYSSTLTIRCDGNKVSISGNPSKFHRIDNLYGLTSFQDVIALYNRILASFGLPSFTYSTGINFYQMSKNGDTNKLVRNGCYLDRLDLTRNWRVGEGNEQSFIRGLSSLHIGKKKEPYLYTNSNTVDWFKGSSYRYIKVYNKAAEMKIHSKNNLDNQIDIDYHNSLIDFCKSNGIVREEHSFKRLFYSNFKQLKYLSQTSSIEEYLPHLSIVENAMQRLTATKTNYSTIAEQLLTTGVCTSTQSANATQSVYVQWLHGSEPMLKRSQFNVHRKRLLLIGACDIACPVDISKKPPQIRSSQIINLEPIDAPDWYRKPVKHLRVV